MNFEIFDEYGYDKDSSYLNRVIKKALEMENACDAIFSIIFVDEERIQNLNCKYRGIDKITDVISFAFLDNQNFQNEEVNCLGEIYICIPRMKEQAKSYGHSETRELSFLTVHGILHLLGYDHMKKEDEEVMFTRQELILDAADIKRENQEKGLS